MSREEEEEVTKGNVLFITQLVNQNVQSSTNSSFLLLDWWHKHRPENQSS